MPVNVRLVVAAENILRLFRIIDQPCAIAADRIPEMARRVALVPHQRPTVLASTAHAVRIRHGYVHRVEHRGLHAQRPRLPSLTAVGAHVNAAITALTATPFNERV